MKGGKGGGWGALYDLTSKGGGRVLFVYLFIYLFIYSFDYKNCDRTFLTSILRFKKLKS